ncbi:MAG: dihydrolipoyl dehydrogenase [Candidatus Bathyarchaeia archaeon]
MTSATKASKPDVLVIGAGPGGYTAAIRAAQLGAHVALVEREEVGGVCVNRGCIPTKTLLHTASVLSLLQRESALTQPMKGLSVNYPEAMARKKRIVDRLVSGIRALLNTNGIELLEGTALFRNARTVEVSARDGGKGTVETERVILATGSRPSVPPIPGLGALGVYTSDNILKLSEVPPSLLVIGGGAVGLEFAEIYRSLGSQVTVVEMMPHILPQEDHEIAEQLTRLMSGQGISILANTRAQGIQGAREGEKTVTVNTPKGARKLEAAYVLMAVGRAPNTEALGLEGLGVAMMKGRIQVDDGCRTNIPGLFAVGDVTGGAFAHAAAAQGVVAAENATGGNSRFKARTTPRCIFTIPQVASVGLTEEEAATGGYKVQVGRFPFSASGAAQAAGEPEGFVKVIADSETGEILGVHILGAAATELISTAALAMRLEATVEDLGNLTCPHPTFAEALKEAALDARGQAIHVARRRAQVRT